jgi:D-cysteine desulfhydrase
LITVTLPLLELLKQPVPHRPLGAFPSPVGDHPRLARELGLTALSVKRDDLNGPEFGGNKLRGLEFLLPASPRGIVTMGGYGSTWCAALARSGQLAGHGVHLALFPVPWTSAVAAALSTTLRHGTVHHAPNRWHMPLAIHRARRAAAAEGEMRWITAGGSDPVGVLGSVNAALEFCRQIDQGEVQAPDAIVVPLGSGGTTAGLLLGFWIAGREVDLCAVRVTDAWFANRFTVMGLLKRTARLLAAHGLVVTEGAARLRIIKDQIGAGYGHGTVASTNAQRIASGDGLILEGTYGAKAFAAIKSLAPSFPRICFWHTFDTRLVSAPPVEHPLLREARLHAESLWPHPKST